MALGVPILKHFRVALGKVTCFSDRDDSSPPKKFTGKIKVAIGWPLVDRLII